MSSQIPQFSSEVEIDKMVNSSRFVLMSSHQIHEYVDNAVSKILNSTIFGLLLLGINAHKPVTPDIYLVLFITIKYDMKTTHKIVNNSLKENRLPLKVSSLR